MDRLWTYYDEEICCYQRVTTSPCPSDEELLKVFPEAAQIISEKLAEWANIKDDLLKNAVKPCLKEILSIKDSFSRWFWRETLKVLFSERLACVNRHIGRLERMQEYIVSARDGKGINIGSARFKVDLEKARTAPILEIASAHIELSKISGDKYIGLCPFHDERTPSFIIYTKTNSFYCFGCHNGGDQIKLVSRLFGFDFRKTVTFLARR